MGGRGGSSGLNSPIQHGKAEQVTVYRDQVINGVNAEGKMSSRAYISDVGGIAVEASYDRKTGTLTLEEPSSFEPKYREVYKEVKYKSWHGSTRKRYDYTTESRVYTLKSGLYQKMNGDGTNSVNLDVTKAKRVEGKTYPFREYLKRKGFKWNNEQKCWEK